MVWDDSFSKLGSLQTSLPCNWLLLPCQYGISILGYKHLEEDTQTVLELPQMARMAKGCPRCLAAMQG